MARPFLFLFAIDLHWHEFRHSMCGIIIRKSLNKIRTRQAQIIDRARILLWKSEAKTDKVIADNLGISINTVRG